MSSDFIPRDDAGRPMDYERYRSLVEREYAEERPRDCVRALHLVDGLTKLVGYDHEGHAVAALTLPTDAIEGTDELWLLSRVRRMSPGHEAIRLVS